MVSTVLHRQRLINRQPILKTLSPGSGKEAGLAHLQITKIQLTNQPINLLQYKKGHVDYVDEVPRLMQN